MSLVGNHLGGNTKNGINSDLRYVSGTKYKGSRNGFLESALDNTHRQRIDDEKRKLGSGSVNVKFYDDNGKELDDLVVNVGGEAYYRNSNGLYRLVDGNVLHEEQELAMENEKYLNNCVSYASSDRAFAHLLGVQMKDVYDICKSCSKITELKNRMTELGLIEINCLPSIVTLYGDGTESQKRAIAKIKCICSYFRPQVIKPKKNHIEVDKEHESEGQKTNSKFMNEN